MAQADAQGDNRSLDELDAALQESQAGAEEAGVARARKIAVSVAEDLEAAAAQLRQACRS